VKKEVKNIAVSVRNRLLNLSTESKRDYNAILRHYFQERFLYRVSISPYKSSLVLKGAFLLMTKDISKFRPTKDIDFLGISIKNGVEECTELLKEISSITADDGVEFITENIKGKKINYKMDTIKGYFSIDIGFDDVINNGPVEIEFPVLLDFPSPKILVYSLESAIAEKFEAIVKLNYVTSRMKDFYDLIFIAKINSFNREVLQHAIQRTFINRGTNLEDMNMVFNKNFINDFHKQNQWQAFINLNKIDNNRAFSEVVSQIPSFIQPVFDSKTKNNWNPEKWKWE